MFHKNKIIFTLLILISLSLIFYRLLGNNLVSLEGLTSLSSLVSNPINQLYAQDKNLKDLIKTSNKNQKDLRNILLGPMSWKTIKKINPNKLKGLINTYKGMVKHELKNT